MLYIYIALFVSFVLCLTGLILSIVNLERYNFGLYLALVAAVGFTVALAFFVVKPKICLGPKWFLRLVNPRLTSTTARCTHVRFNSGSVDRRGTGNRLMFFGFNTVAFFRSHIDEPGLTTTRGAESINQTTKLLESTNQTRGHHVTGGVHFTIDETEAEEDCISIKLNDPPSTTLIPPTPPSFDAHDQNDPDPGIDYRKSSDQSTDNSSQRTRAWTFTCTQTTNQPHIDSIESWHEWQKVLLRDRNPTSLLLRASFPLSERVPNSSLPRGDNGSIGSNSKAWSTEEVVHLDEFLNSNSLNSVAQQKSPSEHHMAEDESSDEPPCAKPHRKVGLVNSDCAGHGHSWQRSHTITVKYVPIRQEWIPKPLAAAIQGRGAIYPNRKRSRSSNAIFTVVDGKVCNPTAGDSSPWWTSVTNVFRRGSANRQGQQDVGVGLV